MFDKILSILTVEQLRGKRTFSLVAIALGAIFWYLTSDPSTWIYQNIEEILVALGYGKVLTLRMALADLLKSKIPNS